MRDEHRDDGRLAAEAAREEQERTGKRRGRWGCLVWIAILIALPALIVTAVGTVLVVVDRQAELDALERAREAGDPVTPAEIRELYGATQETAASTQRWLAVLDAVEIADADPSSKNMPILGMQEFDATLDDRGLYDEATLARVEPFVEGPAKEALEKAHAARDSAKDVRLPIDFAGGFAGGTLRIQELRTLANLLALEAQVLASRGDVTKATDSLVTLIAASETLTEAPDAVAYLVQLAIFGVAVDLAMDLIDRADFPPDDLRRLQQAFARQDFHRPMLRAVRGHQYQGLIHFATDTPLGPGLNDEVRRYPLRGEDQAMLLTVHREFLEEASDSFRAADRAAAKVEGRLEQLQDSRLGKFRYAVTLDIQLAFGALVNAGIRVQAEARVAEACCACERYRQEHGAWPPTLEALVPEYVAAVPLDPVDDRPLRYEVDGEKAIIHSIAHFRPENIPEMRTFDDGFASQVLGESYVPEPQPTEDPPFGDDRSDD